MKKRTYHPKGFIIIKHGEDYYLCKDYSDRNNGIFLQEYWEMYFTSSKGFAYWKKQKGSILLMNKDLSYIRYNN